MGQHGIFDPSPGRCWDCGSPSLRAVTDGENTNFFCPSCRACWHVELGYVQQVDPATCPGCPVPCTGGDEAPTASESGTLAPAG